MEFEEERRPGLAIVAGVLAVILVALLVVAALEPWDRRVSVRLVSFGGGVSETLRVQPGTVLDVSSLPKPSKTGQRFAGWCVDEAATVSYDGAPITGDTALYAAYTAPEDVASQALGQVFLGDVESDFAVTVHSQEPLTGENLTQFVLLTTFYGGESALAVEDLGDSLYRLKLQLPEASAHELQLMSQQVRFADPALEARGVTGAAQLLSFTVPGSSYENVVLADGIRYIQSENLLSVSSKALCVAGVSPLKIGDVIKLPTGDENYYTVLRVIYEWEAGQLGLTIPKDVPYTCYAMEPAQSGQVLSLLEARLRKQLLQADMADIQVLEAEITKALEEDWTVDALADLMIAGAQETEQYQAFSVAQLGSVEAALPTARSTKTTVRVGMATNQANPRYFADMAGYTPNDTMFHSITIQALKQVPVRNLQGDTMVVEAGLTLTVWFHVHVDMAASGTEVIAFDGAVTTLTHTVADLDIQVRSGDGSETVDLGGAFDVALDQAAADTDGTGEFVRLYRQVLGSGAVTLLDQTVAEVSYAAGPLEMKLPVKLQLQLELGGALNGKAELKTGTTTGVRGDTEKGFYSYSYHMDPSWKLQQMAMGHSGIRAGTAFDAQLRFVGLEGLGTVQLQAQNGAFTDVYGYHYLDYYRKGADENVQLAGAYYGRLGLYRAVSTQATVLPKRYADGVYDQAQVLVQLGDRLAVTGLMAEEAVIFDGGLLLSRLPVSSRVLDLTTGRTTTVTAEPETAAVCCTGPFRVEGQRVLYTGNGEGDQGYLLLACGNSSAAFYDALTVRVPVRYDPDGETVPEAEPAACRVYRFHVLDQAGREKVCTVTVPEGTAPRVEHLQTAPEGLEFDGWYAGSVETLTQVQPGVTEYYARYKEKV